MIMCLNQDSPSILKSFANKNSSVVEYVVQYIPFYTLKLTTVMMEIMILHTQLHIPVITSKYT